MTTEQAMAALGGAIAACALGGLVLREQLAHPRPELVRTNVDGRPVPAVLGVALALGGLFGVGVVNLIDRFAEADIASLRMDLAVMTVVFVLSVAGRFDDLRGDELPRGFRGHLAAARGGRLTGGLVKIGAGGVAGAVAGLSVSTGWGILETAVLVALTANLVNLLDRAPGRAAKVAIIAAVPLFSFGDAYWSVASAGMFATLLLCLPFDLGARAMLGDTGSNPLGGLLGLGLAVSLDRPGRLVAIGVLVLLNALSERFSFSRAIEASPPLKWLDMLGRK